MSDNNENLTPKEIVKNLLNSANNDNFEDVLKALKDERRGDITDVEEIVKQLNYHC